LLRIRISLLCESQKRAEGADHYAEGTDYHVLSTEPVASNSDPCGCGSESACLGGVGRDCAASPGCARRVLEAPALVAGLDDVAAVSDRGVVIFGSPKTL
jgi:hypothetical protein